MDYLELAAMSGNRRNVPMQYRLWCGRKCWSGWLDCKEAVWEIALREGLAYDTEGFVSLGPLTRIEERPMSDRPDAAIDRK